jgi:hypothetical protein
VGMVMAGTGMADTGMADTMAAMDGIEPRRSKDRSGEVGGGL